MPDFGIMRGFGSKLFSDKLVAGQLPTQLGLIGSLDIAPPILDVYPNAAVAYSVRKLRTAYTGSAIRVRRSSDNAEQNIGFDGLGNLDTTALTTFCGAGNGFVTTWYDQSVNGRNATQTTAANQPQIVSAGVVLLTNGKPCAKFDGINDSLFYNNSLFTGASQRSLVSVYKPNNSTGSFVYTIFGQTDVGNNGYWSLIQDRTQIVIGDPYFAGFSQDLGNGLTTPNTSQKLAQFNYNGTIGSLYKNNSLLVSSSISLNARVQGLIYIGGNISNEYSDSNIQECIAWTSNQDTNTSGISSNINSYYGIY